MATASREGWPSVEFDGSNAALVSYYRGEGYEISDGEVSSGVEHPADDGTAALAALNDALAGQPTSEPVVDQAQAIAAAADESTGQHAADDPAN